MALEEPGTQLAGTPKETEPEMERLLERLETMEGTGELNLANTYPFLIECCQLAEDVLPRRASDALTVSALYCAGKATKGDLKRERVSCEALYHRQDQNQAAYAVRAVLCCLLPDFEPEGPYGCISWCYDYLHTAGVSDAGIVRVAQTHFPR